MTNVEKAVLEAKVEVLTRALAESRVEVLRLKTGIRRSAETLREWAVAAGGHTPSAIIAGTLFELAGGEEAP